MSEEKKLWYSGGIDMKRGMIYKSDQPMSVPYSKLDDPDCLKIVNQCLDNDEPVLVTLFRESVKNKLEALEGLPMMEKMQLHASFDVSQKLPGRKYRILDWPSKYRSGHDIQRSSHPYIDYRCRLAVIVANEVIGKEEDELFKKTLFSAIHDDTLRQSSKKWVILGDETGGLGPLRFGSKNQATKNRDAMCWIAIPPGTHLPALDPEFHCTGSGALEFYEEAIKNLAEHDSILYFTFQYDEGRINQKNKNKQVKDPHLAFWSDTLPLVLEAVSNRVTKSVEVDVFVEQVGPLESGRDMLTPIIQQLSNALSPMREKWTKLRFDEMWVVSKGEHPWIGYPDALGAMLYDRFTGKLVGKNKQRNSDIFEAITKSPYRQKSLNVDIQNLLKNSGKPLIFLKSLSDISPQDLRDYVDLFFSQAIRECLSKLNEGDWQRLLSHMMETSRTKQGQSATELIHRNTDINATCERLKLDSTKFDFALAMLGTSNHIGAKNQAELCKEIAQQIIAGGFKPRVERMMKYKNLLIGKSDNYFDFAYIEGYDLRGQKGDEEMKFLGAQAQSRALEGTQNNFIEAQEIERYLLENTSHEDDVLRRMILHGELLMDSGDFIGAHQYLTSEVESQLSVSSEERMKKEAYYMASLVKSCALSGQPSSSLEIMKNFIPGLLNNHHPSQRIAYWTLCWIYAIDSKFEDLSKICLKKIKSLTEVPLFTHDAPGVILACELLDLQSKGFDVDGKTFFDAVKKNSQETTQAWLELHPPNEEDWLAPLNFNYR